MKNKLKSVRRDSKNPVASQSKTAKSRARGNHSGTVTCVFFNEKGRESFRVGFRRDLFDLIESCALKLGITLDKFFSLAVENYIRSQAVRRAA